LFIGKAPKLTKFAEIVGGKIDFQILTVSMQMKLAVCILYVFVIVAVIAVLFENIPYKNYIT
jgi:hypothetical protein